MPAGGSDFASASLRHIRDAEHLLDHGVNKSRDQAWHLAGFAHECARKALIHSSASIAGRKSWIPKLLGHDFDDSGERIVEVAIALDPRAGRFPVSEWAKRYPAITAWRPDHRYDRTGSSDQDHARKVEDLVSQGRVAVDTCIVALFLDGTLAIESLR